MPLMEGRRCGTPCQDFDVCFWHLAELVGGLASRPLLALNQAFPFPGLIADRP